MLKVFLVSSRAQRGIAASVPSAVDPSTQIFTSMCSSGLRVLTNAHLVADVLAGAFLDYLTVRLFSHSK